MYDLMLRSRSCSSEVAASTNKTRPSSTASPNLVCFGPSQDFHYALVRPINATAEQVIAQVGPTSLRDEDAVTVEVKVLSAVWQLRVSATTYCS